MKLIGSPFLETFGAATANCSKPEAVGVEVMVVVTVGVIVAVGVRVGVAVFRSPPITKLEPLTTLPCAPDVGVGVQ